MEIIEEGEFCRNIYGNIYQRVFAFPTELKDNEGNTYSFRITSDLKHSKNLEDLIERGDIIVLDGNKYEVIYDATYRALGILIPDKNCLSIRHCSLAYIFSTEGKKEFKTIEILAKEFCIENVLDITKMQDESFYELLLEEGVRKEKL